MVLIKEELGKDWLTSDRFRIGASSLVEDIGSEITQTFKEKPIESPLEANEEEKKDKRGLKIKEDKEEN